MLFLADVTAPIPHFIAFEVVNLIEMLVGIGSFTASGLGAVIAMFGMEMVIYVAVEACGTMKPRAGANEEAAGKPLWTVVAVGGTVVRSNVIVAVRAFRRDADVDLYLSLRFGSGYREADCGDGS